MNIKEIVQNIKRETTDTFKGIDTNPEHIASFPAHLAWCSRMNPLKINVGNELRPLPSFNGPNFGFGPITTSCSECGGSVKGD